MKEVVMKESVKKKSALRKGIICGIILILECMLVGCTGKKTDQSKPVMSTAQNRIVSTPEATQDSSQESMETELMEENTESKVGTSSILQYAIQDEIYETSFED